MTRPHMDVLTRRPGADDEVGAPDTTIVECECGVLFRAGSEHRHDGTWLSHAETRDRGLIA